MFSRLNVRTKLLVMVLPAAIGLSGLAALGVQSRWEDRAVARRAQDTAAVSAAAASFVHRIQLERVVAATAAAVPSPELDSMLQDDRTATDLAGATLSQTLVGSDLGGSTAEDVAAIRRGIGQVDVIRDAATAEQGREAYTTLIRSELAAIGRLELSSGSPSREAVSRGWLSAAIEAESAAAADAAELLSTSATPAQHDAAATSAARLLGQAQLMYDSFADYSTHEANEQLRATRGSVGVTATDPYFAALASPNEVGGFDPKPAAWPGLVRARLAAAADVEATSYQRDAARLDAAVSSADSAVVYFTTGALGSVLAVLLLAFAVSRQLTAALGRLTAAAHDISHEQVPQLVANLKSGGGLAGVRFSEVETGSTDELADVADALNDLGRAMSQVASEQQQSLRKGISDIFVNLARRNQTLLDRQILFIDRLEANEEDPDQLEHLFHLDHLATRMRRNAESLLVLAGAEAPRRRSKEVAVDDVLRVAIGEVEDFARISLLGVEDAQIVGAAAVDLAHLLAEIMENGAQYSPPDRTVDVIGHRAVDGSYIVSITDHGVGMTADRVDAANRMLASPPPVGLALSRSLGFVVAGTLAERHGITVRLRPSSDGGIMAEVVVPAAKVLGAAAAPSSNTATTGGPVVGSSGLSAGASATPTANPTTALTNSTPATSVAGWTASGEYVLPETTPAEFAPSDADFGISWGEERRPDVPAPAKLADALPEGDAFEQGLYSLLGRDAPDTPADGLYVEQFATDPFGADEFSGPATPDLPPPSGQPVFTGPVDFQPPSPFELPQPAPDAFGSTPTNGTAAGSATPNIPGLWAAPIHHPRPPAEPGSPSSSDPEAYRATPPAGPGMHAGAAAGGAVGGLPVAPTADAPPLPKRRRGIMNGATADAGAGPGAASPDAGSAARAGMAVPTRPADEVRSVLSSFRSGRDHGRASGPGTPPPFDGIPPTAGPTPGVTPAAPTFAEEDDR